MLKGHSSRVIYHRIYQYTKMILEATGAKALLPIGDSSFTCEDYNTYRAHPWSPFPLRRAHPGPGPHNNCHVSDDSMGP